MNNLRNKSGFTLVELVITVAIMLMLIAISMPTFQRLKFGARESEARGNLNAIKACQESYKAEYDSYLSCIASPGGIPTSEAVDWVDNGGFGNIGFNPTGRVRYQYAVDVIDPHNFTAIAVGDLDGDANIATFSITNNTNIEKLPNKDVF